MKLREVAESISADVLYGTELLDTIDIQCVYGADLMSDVLAFALPGTLLLTGLTNIQIVRTAQMLDLPAVVFVRGKRPQEAAIQLASQIGMPVLLCPLSMFECCGILFQKGLQACTIPARGVQSVAQAPYVEEYAIQAGDFTAIGEAATRFKATLKMLGISSEAVRRTAVVAYEGEMNALIHAGGGMVRMTVHRDHLVIQVSDAGPGIPDVSLAMQEGYSTASDEIREMGFGAGMGLPNIDRNSDSMTIDTEVGRGTTLRAVIRFSPREAPAEEA